MALAVVSSGTQTATVGTEHTLATSTTGKTYVLVVDLSNLVAGETVELRLKTKVLTGSTAAVAYLASFTGVQVEPVVYSVPVPANWSCAATLKQTSGTGRNFDWALLSVD